MNIKVIKSKDKQSKDKPKTEIRNSDIRRIRNSWKTELRQSKAKYSLDLLGGKN